MNLPSKCSYVKLPKFVKGQSITPYWLLPMPKPSQHASFINLKLDQIKNS